jgi:hypothetical protein
MRPAPLVALVFACSFVCSVAAPAADRPSHPGRAATVDRGVQGDEPDLGDGSDGYEDEPGDEPGTGTDDDPGVSRGAPSRPGLRLPDRPPEMPSTPGTEEEEPPPPPDQPPRKDGPAEPASAMQPLGTE